jgi:hypothetical protein
MKNWKLVLAATSALCLTASQALAQEDPEEGGTEEGTTEGGEGGEGGDMATTSETSPPAAEEGGATGEAPPMILPKGRAQGGLLGQREPLEGPGRQTDQHHADVWYGVAPESASPTRARPGFWGTESIASAGVCITGEENGCAKVHDSPVGVLAHYALVEERPDRRRRRRRRDRLARPVRHCRSRPACAASRRWTS